ncbi:MULTISPECIES: CoA-binding protein [unclassified Leptolyngbya]|uniref:succinate--CoA ligase subunit alpha n=1 Tax=unclassified Leptolyngbya TaxID=2650499 RepID=UPI001685F166|nr:MULTISPECIES: CoA-binding protein [unclassified Leptolyngbya]MBD1910582.1 CoA-binding protein [Leptolyngbya sp. FACHB-8]MBD2153953.1 CoA-binding protein [Leptolyngbya sp. FACHB-16]
MRRLLASSNVLIQGITNPLGSLYTPLMAASGTHIMAGVDSGHSGTSLSGIPVFDMVDEALGKVGPVTTTVIFLPPYEVLDGALEAIAAGIRQIIIITEGVPPLDMVRLLRKAQQTETLVVGPNSPGIIVPGEVLLGTHPTEFYTPGSVGIISRSGSLTYEVALQLTQAGLGQSMVVGIGGDRVTGSSFQQWLQILEEDDRTEAIVLIGSIGGDSEEAAARYISETIDKPVVAYLAGRTAPADQPLGHAGAVIAARLSGWEDAIGTADSKIAAFKAAGIPLGKRPSDIPRLISNLG